ncbi:MAG: hypothetical protein M3Q81_01835 [bacterium]|nr:hypothetical protein [bacterium]
MSEAEYFLIIDGHALIYRAYHAFPGLTTKKGQLVNAVFGFSRHILASLRQVRPTYIAVAFDHPTPTFRHTDYAEYKANRAKMPEDLRPQVEIVKEIVKAMNFPIFEVAGYEADDLIGTLSCKVRELSLAEDPSEPCLKTMIVTGDRDTFQLVNETTQVWLPGRSKQQPDQEYNREAVYKRMGVYPEQIVDLKALMGDASDNIPGVAGVGEKTATTLMQQFGTLDGVYQAIEKPEGMTELQRTVLKPKLIDKLLADKESAFMSRQLATIKCDSPLDLDLEACRVSSYDKEKVAEIFTELDFKSLIPLLPADAFELGVQDALL